MSIIDRIRKRHAWIKDSDPVGAMGSPMNTVTITPRDDRVIHIVATTDNIDLSNEVVVPDGLQPDSYFELNGSLFLDHLTDWDSSIATLRRITPIMGKTSPSHQIGWKVSARIDDGEKGDKVLAKVKTGRVKASIGFLPVNWGKPTSEELKRYKRGDVEPESVIREWIWVETSLTFFPCNVACSVTADVAKMESAELATKASLPEDMAQLFGFGPKPVRLVRCAVPSLRKSA